MNLFTKQPADVLDYDLDFSDWLTGTDVLTGVVATASGPEESNPEDLQIQSASIVGQTAKIWISGGISGSTYKVTATISTSEGRVKQLEFKIRVRDL
jgi:hypothetical protein